MYHNPIIGPHVKPGAILWINCQVVPMDLCLMMMINGIMTPMTMVMMILMMTPMMIMITVTSFPGVLGSLLTKEARLITEDGTIRT